MIFYFKHCFISFNVNEHLVVPFIELARGESCLGHLCFFFFFTQDYLPEHSWSHTTLILLIAWNLPCYFHFAFCLFVWLIKLMYSAPISPLGLFQGITCNNERLKGGPWTPKLLGDLNWRGPNLEGGHQTPLHTMEMYKS